MRWIAMVSLLVLPSAADAGKKKKQAEEVPAPEAPPIEMPCSNVPGDVHRYRYEKTTRKDLPTGTTTRTTRFDLSIEVVSFDGTTSIVDVTFGPTEIVGADPTDPVTVPLMEAMAKFTAEHGNLVARYSTNHTTAEHTVVNLDELVPIYIEVADDTWKGVKAADPSLPDTMGEAMRSMMTPAMVTKSVNDDMSALLAFTCGALRSHRTYETVLPNALGGDPFPAKGTLTVAAKGEVVVITVGESIDPQSVGGIIEPIVRKMLPEGSPELEEMLRGLSVEVATDLEVIVDTTTGWPTGWKSTRVATVSMNGDPLPGGRVDTVECTRLGEG